MGFVAFSPASGTSGGVTIGTALEGVKDCATVCLDFITDNPLMMTMFAGGVIATLAFRFIRKAKRTAR